MTVDEVNERLAEIRRIAADDESAHAAQDGLYVDVLKAIAQGGEDAVGLAAAALEVESIGFSRWYA